MYSIAYFLRVGEIGSSIYSTYYIQYIQSRRVLLEMGFKKRIVQEEAFISWSTYVLKSGYGHKEMEYRKKRSL